MRAKIKKITLPYDKRVICVSDIHGSLDLFHRLLRKVAYTGDDIIILLGDLYLKGKQNLETLRYMIEMSRDPNVHVLRGNCDWGQDSYLSDSDKMWLDDLPHIIESQDYIFVHGGLTSGVLSEQDAVSCMKNDAFMEKGLAFDKYVVTGHWPTINYTHEIPCCNPIVNHDRRIISIDGGNVIKRDGQLNAFLISNREFSFEYVDDLPLIQIETAQTESGGTLHITWNDRYIELLEQGEEFSVCKHLLSGKAVLMPNRYIWSDQHGNLCGGVTDYYLPVQAGDVVSLVDRFHDRILAKKNGTVGWVNMQSMR